jgi:hypothetical protein
LNLMHSNGPFFQNANNFLGRLELTQCLFENSVKKSHRSLEAQEEDEVHLKHGTDA